MPSSIRRTATDLLRRSRIRDSVLRASRIQPNPECRISTFAQRFSIQIQSIGAARLHYSFTARFHGARGQAKIDGSAQRRIQAALARRPAGPQETCANAQVNRRISQRRATEPVGVQKPIVRNEALPVERFRCTSLGREVLSLGFGNKFTFCCRPPGPLARREQRCVSGSWPHSRCALGVR
jgi:hypothetical protein